MKKFSLTKNRFSKHNKKILSWISKKKHNIRNFLNMCTMWFNIVLKNSKICALTKNLQKVYFTETKNNAKKIWKKNVKYSKPPMLVWLNWKTTANSVLFKKIYARCLSVFYTQMLFLQLMFFWKQCFSWFLFFIHWLLLPGNKKRINNAWQFLNWNAQKKYTNFFLFKIFNFIF